jgi:hypothetical protein
VIFYDRKWRKLGTKSGYARWISEIAAIDPMALEDAESVYGIRETQLLQRRQKDVMGVTTEDNRTEDMAYCLLGIFNVNMPLLYGKENALLFAYRKKY